FYKSMIPPLSFLIFFPLVGAFLILLVPKEKPGLIRFLALATGAIVLGASISLLTHFDVRHSNVFQFVERTPWIASMNVWYFLGVDGLSAGLVFLTALLGFIALLASGEINHHRKEYYIFFLVLMTGMMGTFLALDLFLFYIFWEVVLIPMYF